MRALFAGVCRRRCASAAHWSTRVCIAGSYDTLCNEQLKMSIRRPLKLRTHTKHRSVRLLAVGCFTPCRRHGPRQRLVRSAAHHERHCTPSCQAARQHRCHQGLPGCKAQRQACHQQQAGSQQCRGEQRNRRAAQPNEQRRLHVHDGCRQWLALCRLGRVGRW